MEMWFYDYRPADGQRELLVVGYCPAAHDYAFGKGGSFELKKSTRYGFGEKTTLEWIKERIAEACVFYGSEPVFLDIDGKPVPCERETDITRLFDLNID